MNSALELTDYRKLVEEILFGHLIPLSKLIVTWANLPGSTVTVSWPPRGNLRPVFAGGPTL
jgi:hypothetical protein